MKKIPLLLTAAAMSLGLAVTAGASTVIYQGGAAADNYVQGTGGALNIEVKLDEPVNISDYDYMYVRYYVEDPEAYSNNGQIEITSSGSCDIEEYSWDLNSMPMEAGWNEWVIDLYTGAECGGPADFEKINYFRTYAFVNGSNTVALDYVAFGMEGEDFSSLATELGDIEQLVYVPVDEVKRVGEGDAGAPDISAKMDVSPVNISNYDYMFMRVYVEGVDNMVGDGQLEITSSGGCDQQETHWFVTQLGLVDGWNELQLDLYAPDEFGMDCNMEKINFFRMYQFTEGPLKFELDYIGFGNDGDVFGEDTLPLYFVKPASMDVPAETEAPTEEVPAEPAVEETEAPVAEETEAPAVEETTEEVVVPAEPAETEKEEAPQTFDAVIIAGAAAVISLAGYAFSKKR